MRAHNDVKKMYYKYELSDIHFFKKIYCMIMISPFKKSRVLLSLYIILHQVMLASLVNNTIVICFYFFTLLHQMYTQ